ncbi:MAG: hypothetical protein FJ106_08915 [Deltaproteobacteria bacterium]|nr:hypothetical protein [Deltaproteobacteria bacterium]
MVAHDEFATKADLKEFKDEIIHEFHVVSEGLMDHIKLLAEGHSGVVQRLDRVDTRFDQVEIRLDRVETRLDHMETRLDRVDTRFDQVETRLDRVDTRLDHMGKENERQHIETRALIKLSFSELDKRLSDLESQVKELQDWRKQIQSRLQI